MTDFNQKTHDTDVGSDSWTFRLRKNHIFKTLNGLLEQERGVNVSGRIMLEEADIHSLSMEELRKNVGLVFQTPALFPFSIYKNLT